MFTVESDLTQPDSPYEHAVFSSRYFSSALNFVRHNVFFRQFVLLLPKHWYILKQFGGIVTDTWIVFVCVYQCTYCVYMCQTEKKSKREEKIGTEK